jgi:tetratricopeptide (TPR) repeat protein
MDYQFALNIIKAALDPTCQQPGFARRTAERWLMEQPGHLTMTVLLADALLADGDRDEARRVLREVLHTDPENSAALALKTQLHELDGDVELIWATAAALRQVAPGNPIGRAQLARMADRAPNLPSPHIDPDGDPGGAADQPRPDRPVQAAEANFLALIPSLSELEELWRGGQMGMARDLAEQLLSSYPRLVKAHLILSDCQMGLGEEAAAVAHIHQAVSLDPGGEVAGRIWGGDRPYVGAWPPAYIPGGTGPLPYPLASALGLNLLPEPAVLTADSDPSLPTNGRGTLSRSPSLHDRTDSPASPSSTLSSQSPISFVQETLLSIQAEINRLSGDVEPRTGGAKETRVSLKPIYAIICSREPLRAKYGDDGWEQIDRGLQSLARAAESRLQVPAGVIYIDDAASLASFKLDPVDPADPWAVKLLLDQLDSQLEQQKQQVGWVLLVGGGDVIAYHRLPNPTDDSDQDVLSDNPYGCRDENYFVPQRAVGRLPDGVGGALDGNPTLLLRSIETAIAAHNASRRARRWWLARLLERLFRLFQGGGAYAEASFGYSASIWRKASLTVFSTIGSARRLRTCPPLTAAEFSSLPLGRSRYGYFNLHGIADGPNWYGQRDPAFPADYPAFPIALRPEDLDSLGGVPEVVFSEACFGALAEGKSAETALCLRFLDSRTHMFVGSTCIAYGGLNSTPEAADLLAAFFWQEIMAGRTGGVALQQAKVAFAQYLSGRQGYLDGEDQKTLISFVYYGDPTLKAPPSLRGAPILKKTMRRKKVLTAYPARVCAKELAGQPATPVPDHIVEQVRARVTGYLPGMAQADLAVARQWSCKASSGCTRQCGGCQRNTKQAPAGKMVLTLSQSSHVAGKNHEQVVKVTVDDSGKMLKLTVSK